MATRHSGRATEVPRRRNSRTPRGPLTERCGAHIPNGGLYHVTPDWADAATTANTWPNSWRSLGACNRRRPRRSSGGEAFLSIDVTTDRIENDEGAHGGLT